MENWPFFTTIR